MVRDRAPYLDHRISARRPRALIAIGLFWLGAALFRAADAMWWVPVALIGVSLPACLEALRNDTTRLTLGPDDLAWHSRRHSGRLALPDIDYVRFDTRMDLAMNARLHLRDGSVMRLPIEVVPPYKVFCAALDDAGLRHERHHFGFL